MNPQEAKKLEAKVLQELQKTIKKCRRKVILGHSGGPDSVFLHHLLNQITPRVVVAHVNHQVRPREAELDENFVHNLAGKFENDFESLHVDIPKLSKKKKQGIEETGRIVRYMFFEDLAEEYKAKFIITAHHADDNLETILMNLTRGASLQGLSGMERLQPLNKKVSLYRPLLSITKKEIIAYLKLKNIRFRIDKTNANKNYTRNFIRHEIIPKLETLNPNISKAVAKNAENLFSANEIITKKANFWITANSKTKSHNRFPLKKFNALPIALRQTAIREIYRKITGSTENIERVHIDEVLSLIEKGHGNKKKKLGKLVVSIKSGNIVLL